MSSSGPYQSRLFNLLNRHRIRWSDRVTQTVRQIKVATEWGVQTLLYPIYLMVQMGRSTRQQLEQQVYSSAALPPGSELEVDTQMQFSAVDAPIEQVLQAVKPFLIEGNEEKNELEAEQTNIWGKLGKFVAQFRFHIPQKNKTRWFGNQNKTLELTGKQLPQQVERSNLVISSRQSLIVNANLDRTNSLPQRDKKVLTIQGIASLVESRILVLVTQDNQILDILTSQQQQQLQQRIIQALAGYRPYQGFLKTTTKKILRSLPDFSANNSKALPPVRFAWDIIEWVQTSPIAIKANLFGESSLVSVSSESTEISHKRYGSTRKAGLPLEELSIILDRALAGLETQSQNLVTLIERVGNNLPLKINQTDTLQQKQSFEESLNAAKEHSEPDPFQLQILIQAAIDYFFGKVSGKNLSHSSGKTPLQPTISSHSLPIAPPEAPWLSWSDLFSDTISSATSTQTSQKLVSLERETDQKSLPEAARKPTKSRQWNRSKIKSLLQPPKSRALSVVQTQPTDVTLKQQEDSTLTSTDNCTGTEVTSSFSSPQVTPDWVETNATAVGYVKHPLEILLELLDRTILWLEELALNIWKQVKVIFSLTPRRKER